MVDGSHGHFEINCTACLEGTGTEDMIPSRGDSVDTSTQWTKETSLDCRHKEDAKCNKNLKAFEHHDEYSFAFGRC